LCLGVVIPAVPPSRRTPTSETTTLLQEVLALVARPHLVGSRCVAQFFGLEMFFRGFWLNGLRRSMGLIGDLRDVRALLHDSFGKPYLETCGAVVAGIALGSLSMRTKSIYSGFLVHVTVAILMDTLAISQAGGLPTQWAPTPAQAAPALLVVPY
jgi:membrane protease YdiL (CAAX protease family)